MSDHPRRRSRTLAGLTAAALAVSGLATLVGPASAEQAPVTPAYYPSGPQTGVPVATVTDGGWTQCYLDKYADNLEAARPALLQACDGKFLMLAGRATGSDTLTLLAAAPREDVLTDTGVDRTTTHAANGSEWYFNDHYSWGFAPGGSPVAKNQCDTTAGSTRLCWHLVNGDGGYRLGDVTRLNISADYERVVYESDGRLPQSVAFTSTPPTKGYVDGRYDVFATGGPSGNPVTFGAGPSEVCTVVDHTVTFTGPGECTVTAAQSGNREYADAPQVSQTIAVSAKAAQAVAFDTTAPEAPYVGSSYPVAASSDSGLPVTLGSATPDVCTVADGTVSVVAAGDCTITADQPGDAQTAPAAQVVQTTTAQKVTPLLVLDLPTGIVSGQQTTVSATVTPPQDAPAGTPAGSVQFSVGGDPLGGPVAVDAGGSATSPAFAGGAGQRQVQATFTPADATTYSSAVQSAELGVAKAGSETTLSVLPTQLRASVSAVAPGSAEATGSVEFRVGGDVVGSADVVDGTAVLTYTVPSGMTRQVSAEYSGNDDLMTSASSVTRADPTVTATVTSDSPESAAGYYRTPVTIQYSCTVPEGATLTEPCPADDVATADGTSTFEHTVRTTDGGVGTVSTTVDVDRTAPVVTIPGVERGRLYFAHAPAAHPTATDATSGIASATTTVTRGPNVLERVTVVATDNAGNTTRRSVVYGVVDHAIAGATYTGGRWNVPRGAAFTVQARTPGVPVLVAPATTPGALTGKPASAMRRIGSDQWQGTVAKAPASTTTRNYWVGVRQGGRTVAIPFRTVG